MQYFVLVWHIFWLVWHIIFGCLKHIWWSMLGFLYILAFCMNYFLVVCHTSLFVLCHTMFVFINDYLGCMKCFLNICHTAGSPQTWQYAIKVVSRGLLLSFSILCSACIWYPRSQTTIQQPHVLFVFQPCLSNDMFHPDNFVGGGGVRLNGSQ